MMAPCCCGGTADGSEEDVRVTKMGDGSPFKEIPVATASGTTEEKSSGQAPQAARSQGAQFTIQINKKSSDSLGAEVLMNDTDRVKLLAICPGPLAKWNTDNPDKAVKCGDYILSVNGTKGSPTTLMDLIAKNSTIDLGILSTVPILYSIKCVKKSPNDSLGIDVDAPADGKIKILGIINDEGLLARWNQANKQNMVLAGDYIIEVNGANSSQAMLSAVKNDSTLNMKLSRP
jgi:C-terminal processing protease CtpA/Prc